MQSHLLSRHLPKTSSMPLKPPAASGILLCRKKNRNKTTKKKQRPQLCKALTMKQAATKDRFPGPVPKASPSTPQARGKGCPHRGSWPHTLSHNGYTELPKWGQLPRPSCRTGKELLPHPKELGVFSGTRTHF